MAQVLDGNIDFSAYMTETDASHSCKKPSSYLDEVLEYFETPNGMRGATMPWAKTHRTVRFRAGEVSLWNGMNGHGKSMILGQVCMALMEQGEPVCIASMEMKPHMTLARMCRQAFGGQSPDIEFIRAFHTNTDHKLWMYDQQGTVKTDKMLAVIRYCADNLNIKHIIVDSLMKCGMGEDDYNGQKAFIDQLTAAARDHQVHIHLVTHARKGSDELKPPGKMDVKGSGAITDQVDNVFTVWRNKGKERQLQESPGLQMQLNDEPDALILCDKQRNGEWEGTIKLWFDPMSQQFKGDWRDGSRRIVF